jgi:hypothetical protein
MRKSQRDKIHSGSPKEKPQPEHVLTEIKLVIARSPFVKPKQCNACTMPNQQSDKNILGPLPRPRRTDFLSRPPIASMLDDHVC